MVNIQPQAQQPMSDDQELAKVLAGVTSQQDDSALPTIDDSAFSMPEPEQPVIEQLPDPVVDVTPVEQFPEPTTSTNLSGDTGLDGIKKDAIFELRPLVDKLELQPEEKFDTYLLLLRSTDDKALVGPAHEAAKNIPDESRRAQALLDIIKEIDFLSGQHAA